MAQIISPPVDFSSLKINTIRNGSGGPANNMGIDGDFYIDKDLFNFYGPKTNGQWPSNYTSLIGPSASIQRTSPQIVTQTGTQTINLPIANPSYIAVFYNGQLVSENDYTRSGAVITIPGSFNVSLGSKFQVEYFASSGSSGGGGGVSSVPVQEYVVGAIDGINKQFSISHVPAANTLRLFLNGSLVDFSTYSLSGSTIVLNKAPAIEGSNLTALYSY